MADTIVRTSSGGTVSVPDRYLKQYQAANPTSTVQYTPQTYTREQVKATPSENYVRYNNRVVKESDLPYSVRKNIRKAVNPIELYKMGLEADKENYAYRVTVSGDDYQRTGVSPFLRQQYKKFIETGNVKYVNSILGYKMWKEGARAAFAERERFIGMGIKHTSLTGRYGGGIQGRVQHGTPQNQTFVLGMQKLRAEKNPERSNVSRSEFVFSGGETIRRGGEKIKTSSEEGKAIERQYWWQQRAREINKAQSQMYWAVTRAPNAERALYEKYSRTQDNPNIGTFQQIYSHGQLVYSEGTRGIGDTPIKIGGKMLGAAPEGMVGYVKGSIGSYPSVNLYNSRGDLIARDVKQTGGFDLTNQSPEKSRWFVEIDGKKRTFNSKENAEKFMKNYSSKQPTSLRNVAFNDIRPIIKEDKFNGVVGNLTHIYGEKPMSSSGERIQFAVDWLERKQKEAVENDRVRYYKSVGGVPKRMGGLNLVPMGLEVIKDAVSGIGYVENLFWQGEAAIRGGSVKTKEIQIPETATGIIFQGAMERKSPTEIQRSLSVYEKTHGRGTTIAGVAGMFIPLPVGKLPKFSIVSAVQKYPKFASATVKIGETIRYPQMKNFVSRVNEKIEFSGEIRRIKKFEKKTVEPGINYRVEKLGKKYAIVTYGMEEARNPIKPEIKNRLVWSSEKRELRYPKAPSQVHVPNAPVPERTVPLARVYKLGTKMRGGIEQPVEKFVKERKSLPAMKRLWKAPVLVPVENTLTTKQAVAKRVVQFGNNLKTAPVRTYKQYVSDNIAKLKEAGGELKKAPKQYADKYVMMREVGIKYTLKEQAKKITSNFASKKKSRTTWGTMVEDIYPAEHGGKGKINELVATSPDAEFKTTAEYYKMTQASKHSYNLFNPKKDVLQSFEKAESAGILSTVATGKKIPFSVLRKSWKDESFLSKMKKTQFRQNKKLITDKAQMREIISEGKKPSKFSGVKKRFTSVAPKRKSEDIFDFVGKKTQEVKYVETREGGTYNAKGYAEFTGKRFSESNVRYKNIGTPDKPEWVKQKSPFKKYVGASKERYLGIGSSTFDKMVPNKSVGNIKKINADLKRFGFEEITEEELRKQQSVVKERKLDFSKSTPLRFEKEPNTKSIPHGKAILDETLEKILPRFKETGFREREARTATALLPKSVPVKRQKTHDYLTTVSRYTPSASLENMKSGSIGSVDEDVVTYSKQKTSPLERLMPKRASRTMSKMETSYDSLINYDTLTREKLREKPESRLRNTLVSAQLEKLKTTDILAPKTIHMQKPKTDLIIKQREQNIQKQRSEIVQKQKTILETTTPTKTIRTRPGILFPVVDLPKIRTKRKKKNNPEYAADFLGAASESSVFGLTSRDDVTYGRVKTARLSALDLRKRIHTPSAENPENYKISKKKRTESTDIYSEKYKGSYKKTKENLLGGKKVKFNFFK